MQLHTDQYSTIQNNTEQYRTIQNNTAQYSGEQRHTTSWNVEVCGSLIHNQSNSVMCPEQMNLSPCWVVLQMLGVKTADSSWFCFWLCDVYLKVTVHLQNTACVTGLTTVLSFWYRDRCSFSWHFQCCLILDYNCTVREPHHDATPYLIPAQLCRILTWSQISHHTASVCRESEVCEPAYTHILNVGFSFEFMVHLYVQVPVRAHLLDSTNNHRVMDSYLLRSNIISLVLFTFKMRRWLSDHISLWYTEGQSSPHSRITITIIWTFDDIIIIFKELPPKFVLIPVFGSHPNGCDQLWWTLPCRNMMQLTGLMWSLWGLAENFLFI